MKEAFLLLHCVSIEKQFMHQKPEGFLSFPF